MLRRIVKLFGIGIALALVALAVGHHGQVGWAQAGSPPTITAIEFPTQLPDRGQGTGKISFTDPDGDIIHADFHGVDGWYLHHSRIEQGVQGITSGSFEFSMPCSSPFSPQQFTYRVILTDQVGNRSAPSGFTFTCGTPYVGNYDQEQATVREASFTVPLNIFILDDGRVTALAENARPSAVSPALADPDPAIVQAFSNQITAELNGIWDQCGLAFQMNIVKVVKPQEIRISEGALNIIFGDEQGKRYIYRSPKGFMGRAILDILSEAFKIVKSELVKENQQIAPEALNTFLTGAVFKDSRGGNVFFGGFGQIGGTLMVMTWGAIWVTDPQKGSIFTPKQPIATLAHELGHNLGIKHPGEDGGLPGTLNDANNLMWNKAVGLAAPAPKVNLLPVQCKEIRRAPPP